MTCLHTSYWAKGHPPGVPKTFMDSSAWGKPGGKQQTLESLTGVTWKKPAGGSTEGALGTEESLKAQQQKLAQQEAELKAKEDRLAQENQKNQRLLDLKQKEEELKRREAMLSRDTQKTGHGSAEQQKTLEADRKQKEDEQRKMEEALKLKEQEEIQRKEKELADRQQALEEAERNKSMQEGHKNAEKQVALSGLKRKQGNSESTADDPGDSQDSTQDSELFESEGDPGQLAQALGDLKAHGGAMRACCKRVAS